MDTSKNTIAVAMSMQVEESPVMQRI